MRDASAAETPTDPTRMGALELAEAIKSRRVSSEEVVAAHLRRIAELNPTVNAVTAVLEEEALEAAKISWIHRRSSMHLRESRSAWRMAGQSHPGTTGPTRAMRMLRRSTGGR